MTRLLAAAAGAALLASACGTPTPESPFPSLTPPTLACSAAGVAASDQSALQTVCILTSQGEVVVELDPGPGPTPATATVANFLTYVNEGFFARTVFHRVVAGFVVQGGGVDVDDGYRLTWKTPTHPAIALESDNGLRNLRGTIAMARTASPDTASSQFFFNLVDNAALDHDPVAAEANGYAVFGRVISGMATVDRIAALPTTQDLPFPMVVVYWATQLR